MTPDQLRKALGELNGERDAVFVFADVFEQGGCLTVHRAMLIPDEPDHLVKVTDGKSVFLVEAERVAYVRIALSRPESHPPRH